MRSWYDISICVAGSHNFVKGGALSSIIDQSSSRSIIRSCHRQVDGIIQLVACTMSSKIDTFDRSVSSRPQISNHIKISSRWWLLIWDHITHHRWWWWLRHCIILILIWWYRWFGNCNVILHRLFALCTTCVRNYNLTIVEWQHLSKIVVLPWSTGDYHWQSSFGNYRVTFTGSNGSILIDNGSISWWIRFDNDHWTILIHR